MKHGFLIRQGTEIVLLVQVTESLKDVKTRERAYKALNQAMKELHVGKALILTLEKEPQDPKFLQIEVVPIYQWLLSPKNRALSEFA